MKKRRKASTRRLDGNNRLKSSLIVNIFLFCLVIINTTATTTSASSQTHIDSPLDSGIKFDPQTGSYSGLTFSFDPRLDKAQVERLHFETWLSIVHQASTLLYNALSTRAHLAEVRVLIPYKWRLFEWPLLHKPGSPIINNRRLRYSDSDVIVGLEDPIYKETPFSLQHDECGKPGLNIHMPISFLEEPQVDERLKARQFLREFASHRWGLFKESGFRSDYMYPTFTALAGLTTSAKLHWSNSTGEFQLANQNQSTTATGQLLDENSADASSASHQAARIATRGYDDQWNECSFNSSPASGLPLVNAQNCLPYMVNAAQSRLETPGSTTPTVAQSFNLMNSDPFSYATKTITDPSEMVTEQLSGTRLGKLPENLVNWRQLADSTSWHFCGEGFPAPSTLLQLQSAQDEHDLRELSISHEHNPRTISKQNKFCSERSAFDVIRSSEDFRRGLHSLQTFKRIPEPQFKFLQEMPPRVILAVEYTSHLYSSRRQDLPVIQAAINKFLAFDLIPDSEVATIVFGQHHSNVLKPFVRLDSNLDNRFALFTPAIAPYDEQASMFTQQQLIEELSQAKGHVNNDAMSRFNQQQHQPAPKIIKGTSSFERLMEKVNSLLQKMKFTDVGADLVLITSGLFVEDTKKIEEIVNQSQFRADQHKLNLIIYPASMLFDTKSRDHYAKLEPLESEVIVKNRIEKLLLIQKLLNGQIHLVKEHLDSNGAIKMSTTLNQFYQIFEHISRGHSWDQTNSMMVLEQRLVDSKPNVSVVNGNKLTYQFEFDSTISNELFVAFVDPRPSSFALKGLELRSPSGQLHFTERNTASSISLTPQQRANATLSHHQLESDNQYNDLQLGSVESETAFFQYRPQLNLAGFHLKPWHLDAASASSNIQSLGRPHASGTWTLTASSEEPLHTSAVLMAKTNPTGDSLGATCWVQSYSELDKSEPASSTTTRHKLTAVKVFVKLNSGQNLDISSVGARFEVHDEMGNIVENSRLLDDGLGSPDITRNDQILSQYIHRAQRPGFYKVSVEVNRNIGDQQATKLPTVHSQRGQDNACCGSFIPKSHDQFKQPIIGHLRRQIYCGTFYVEGNNKLGEEKPPRITNMTVVDLDQDQRRITLRWFEPQVLETAASNLLNQELTYSFSNNLRLINQGSEEASLARAKRSHEARGVIVAADRADQPIAPLSSRYEIKLFMDRDILKRSFDSKSSIGYKFTEWNVEGTLPNASTFGGQKEVTLKIPDGREGIYFIAMKIYNNMGIAGELSNIVQFYLRNNLTLEELEALHGIATTTDADGNVYDRNGVLIRRGSLGVMSGSLRGSNSMDGLSVLILLSVLTFFMAVVCIALVMCVASSARRPKKTKDSLSKKHGTNGGGASSGSMLAGSGSSMVSAGSSPAASSSSSSCGSNDGDAIHQKHMMDSQQRPNQYAGVADYDNQCLQQAHEHQQQQAQMIHNQMLANGQYQYQQHQQAGAWPQHTIVNGYTYATVGGVKSTGDNYGDPYGSTQAGQHVRPLGDLNQNGLGLDDGNLEQTAMSPVQSWPAEVLLSHYDKVKQARERNEAPPVMRFETLDSSQINEGLPSIVDQTEQAGKYEQSFLLRQQQQQMSTYMINKQLQQQLSSVLKSKRQRESNVSSSSSPALEGVRGELELDHQQASAGQQLVAPPPPQYIYCTPSDVGGAIDQQQQQQQLSAAMTNGLATHHTDPSIYSQTTNLQQVVTSDNYYANQWAADQSLYGTNQQHQYQEDNGNFTNQANSAAISEV